MRIINERYEVIQLLTRENSYIEYLVSDKQKNNNIKRIRIFDTEMSNYDFIKQMEAQFVEMKTVVHDHILSDYEFQSILTVNGNRVTRKQYFYTYEHYDDAKLVNYIELNKTEINTVIVQLLKAVRFLHFRGFLYKYLNFDQILILRIDGQIVLKLKDVAGNFINDYYFKSDHERFGLFIAPEIVWGEETDYLADIYSLGVIVYYLYYRLDYKFNSIQNIHISSYANEIHRFIMKATSHIRDERHENIHAFIEELSTLIWIEVSKDDIKFYDKVHDATRIIGRDTLIKEIKTKIVEKSKKTLTQNAFVIQGENGSGKTRVLNEIYYVSKFERFPYVYLKPSKGNDAFYTIKTIIESIHEQGDISPMLIQKYGGELIHLVPELANDWNIKEYKSLDVHREAYRLLNRVYHFFVEYTNSKFMLLLIDDFEKLSSVEKIFYQLLFSNKNITNYYVVTTCDEDTHFESEIMPLISMNKLAALNLEETGLLIKAMLGLNYIPYKLTHRLMIENQGKANLTRQLVKKLWYDSVIFFDGNKFEWNFDEVDDNYVFEYINHKRDAFDQILNSVSKTHYEVLRRLSVLKGSFSMQTVFAMGEITEEEGYHFLYEMEDKRILNKRISDVEYVFAFSSNEVKKVFFDTLSDADYQQLCELAADLYEKRYLSTGELSESLIDYLVSSDQQEKAAHYCGVFCDHYMAQNNSLKSIEMLEQGVEIHVANGQNKSAIQMIIKLIRIMIKAGKLERAMDRVHYLYDFITSDDLISKVDIQIEHAYILYFQNELSQSNELSIATIELAQNINYLDGEMRAAYVKCKCLVGAGDLDAHRKMTDHYLQLSQQENNVKHLAVFFNELGINFLYNNLFSQGMEAFKKSLNYYQQLEDDENIIKLYNNLGVIKSDGYGDYIEAREYFRRAYTRANNKNYLVNLPIYLNNLGETYRIEGRYEMAIKQFAESNKLAEEVGDKNLVLLSLINLCHGYLLNEHYGKSNKLMTRLEHEVQSIKKRGYDKFDYYLLHFEYYLAMNAIMKVNQWRYEFNADEVVDDYRKFRLKIIDMRLTFMKDNMALNRKSERESDKKIPFAELDTLLALVVNPAEAQLLREVVQDLVIECIVEKDYLNAEKLLRLDDRLMTFYNTRSVRLKRDFIEACLSDYSTERIEVLIDQIKEQSLEFLWKTYNILGDAYIELNNTYEALRYYLMALDVIADLSSSIPQDYKETYILHDDIKMALKNKINRIIRVLLNFEGVKYGLLIEGRIDTVEDFFDLSQFNMLYDSSEFLNLVYKNYKNKEKYHYDSATDLIRHLEKDEIANLKCILRYLQQITLGERACIYMLDENDNISEVICANEYDQQYDILKLVNNYGNDVEGLYVSKLNPGTSLHLLLENQKGLISFPIFESFDDQKKGEKRKEDMFINKKKIVGYVFLDTTNVINRFNEYTFEQSKSFMNLFYVFITNYNLKKLSTIDKLTGVYLRKYIEQQFAVQMSISRQNTFSLSVIMLDIDKFKNVNDTYGHRKGDEILSRIGDLLMNSVRSTDFVGRYGGEEFIILLPETDSGNAFKVAEKIRRLVEKSKLLGEDKPLTVSLGVSTYPLDGANEDELIEKADQALYYSKNNGRNKSTSWDNNLIKEGHRYDRLTGILTENMSSDTRYMQAILDIMNQLNHQIDRESSILNAFISLLDITEGEEIQFLKFDAEDRLIETFFKRKGQADLSEELVLSDRLLVQFKSMKAGHYFIDWEEQQIDMTDKEMLASSMPDWKSYIALRFQHEGYTGILAISVSISIKEFDFSNYNFVDSLRPILEHLFL